MNHIKLHDLLGIPLTKKDLKLTPEAYQRLLAAATLAARDYPDCEGLKFDRDVDTIQFIAYNGSHKANLAAQIYWDNQEMTALVQAELEKACTRLNLPLHHYSAYVTVVHKGEEE